jgi:hypothetical protein
VLDGFEAFLHGEADVGGGGVVLQVDEVFVLARAGGSDGTSQREMARVVR